MVINPRFTINCLKELGIQIPNLPQNFTGTLDSNFMHSINHPLLTYASRLKKDSNDSLQRIKCIDDNIFFKCKPNIPVRGAIWVDSLSYDYSWWIVSGGKREKGSKQDFYHKLELSCTTQLKLKRMIQSNIKPNKNTYSDHLLPQKADYTRLMLEHDYIETYKHVQEIKRIYSLSKKYLDHTYSIFIKDNFVELKTVKDGNCYETYIHIQFSPHYTDKIANFIMSVIQPDDWNVDEPPKGKIATSLHEYVYAFIHNFGPQLCHYW